MRVENERDHLRYLDDAVCGDDDGDNVRESEINSGGEHTCEGRRFWRVGGVPQLVGGQQHLLGGVDRHVQVVVGVVDVGPLCL